MKYIDAERLEKAKELYPTANADQRYVLECLFPELKESEDERIRETLLNYFKDYKTQEEIGVKRFFGIPTDDIIAWLEKQSNTIYANEFNRYASALETLSEEEIHLLASMYNYRKNARPPYTRITARGIEGENDFLQNFSKHYRYENKISEEQYISMCSALLRTGLIYPRTYIRETTYDLSPFFDEIVKLVDFQDALKKENLKVK